jgi:hypothetical protein
MKITGSIIFSCCCIPPAFAQELKGIVSDTESAKLLAGVRVENKTRKSYTATNTRALFPFLPFPAIAFSSVLLDTMPVRLSYKGQGVCFSGTSL